ncbi:MAG: hypothetical protein IPJ13_30780 [Saprospiraceae bacterium]|jgi:hypothetical protein|nr:hypothetical protein [Saprospiraceae bacterium]
MKYRRLTAEELSGLEKEFVHYLIINGIDAQEWEKIKSVSAEKADKMIEIYSDMVFEGICAKVKYCEYFDKDGLKLFRCDEDEIRLTEIIPTSAFDSVQEMMTHLAKNPDEFRIFYTSKGYKPDRNLEIFRMISAGAVITNGTYYEHFQ